MSVCEIQRNGTLSKTTSLYDVAHGPLKHSQDKLYLSLVSARASGAVQQVDCRIPVQFTGVFAHNVVMFQYDASGFCGHVVLNGSHAGLS